MAHGMFSEDIAAIWKGILWKWQGMLWQIESPAEYDQLLVGILKIGSNSCSFLFRRKTRAEVNRGTGFVGLFKSQILQDLVILVRKSSLCVLITFRIRNMCDQFRKTSASQNSEIGFPENSLFWPIFFVGLKYCNGLTWTEPFKEDSAEIKVLQRVPMGKGIKNAESTNRDQKMSHKVQIEKFVVHVLTFFSGVYWAKVIVSQSKILFCHRRDWNGINPHFRFCLST